MTSFFSDPAVGGDGSTTTDDANAATGLDNGGFRTRLLPMFTQIISVANWIKTNGSGYVASAAQSVVDAAMQVGLATDQAVAAAASAATAANSPNTQATSTTSDTIALGATSITIQTGKALSVGQSAKFANTASPTNWMFGTITAYNSATGLLSLNVTEINGSGTFAAWTVSVAGPQGVSGTNAYTGKSQRTSNAMLSLADLGKIIEITSGTFTQTFDAFATLGSKWHVWLKNSGTGNITIPSSDGVTNWVMYPGEARFFSCDGSALTSFVIAAFAITITSSVTFIKPPGYSAFEGEVWGGGASGAKGSAGGVSSGGGGGACCPFNLAAFLVAATEVLTVAAGGVAVSVATTAGNVGGTSSFGSLVFAYGGGPGGAIASLSDRTGGGGGGIAGAGAAGGGNAQGGLPANGSTYGADTGFGGGGTANGGSTPGRGTYGGGAGGPGNSAAVGSQGGASTFGGAGGGGAGGGANGPGAGGVSTLGGNGGAASQAGSGVAGTAPGGGGGATQTGASSGAGARGEIRIRGVV